jgi:hypothetical protein
MSKHYSPTFTKEVVTPEMAEFMLMGNTSNRRVRTRHINRLSSALKDGRWRFNGESIKIASDGTLVDGQHRLIACMNAGVPFETIIVRGVDPEAFVTIDIGTKRLAADAMKEITNPNTVAAAVRWMVAINSKKSITNTLLDIDQIVECFEENPGLEQSGRKLTNFRLCAPALATALHYLFSLKDAGEADRFFTDLKDGEGLSYGDPALTLRNKLIEARVSSSKKRTTTTEEVCAQIIRAWNARRSGRPITSLRGFVKNDAGRYVMPDIE